MFILEFHQTGSRSSLHLLLDSDDLHFDQVWMYVNQQYGANGVAPYIFVNSIRVAHRDEVVAMFERYGWPILTEEIYYETFPD